MSEPIRHLTGATVGMRLGKGCIKSIRASDPFHFKCDFCSEPDAGGVEIGDLRGLHTLILCPDCAAKIAAFIDAMVIKADNTTA